MLDSELLNTAGDLLRDNPWGQGGGYFHARKGLCALDFIAVVQGGASWSDALPPQRLVQVCADWCLNNIPEHYRRGWDLYGRDWVYAANDWHVTVNPMTKEKMLGLFRFAAVLARVDEVTGHVYRHVSPLPIVDEEGYGDETDHGVLYGVALTDLIDLGEPPVPQFVEDEDERQEAERIELDPMIREVHDEEDDDCLVQERLVPATT